MSKKLLKTATALTIMGGVLFSAESNNVKAESAPLQNTNTIVFKDVPIGHWSYEAIHNLAAQEIIFGYGDGVFGFGDDVTREQVAALIYRVFDIEEQDEYENPYGDIDENSTDFIEEILALTEMEIFMGDEHGNFRPKATLTRAEMAQVLTNAFDLQAKGSHTFNDVSADSWAKNAISAIKTNDITVGIGENKFGPSMKVTREQYAQFLYKAMLNDMTQQ
ncbi:MULTISPECIES: S-layer homology domain-containing protein [Bacillus]|uniref:S-layer protein n=2 Tax=Bacillus cereus group TaxID=86661 RepID=R8QNF3_BACCE|nr:MULTISPECIES: S-layer homology domain-containing protein [Bacillus cereus group]EOP72322.1 S-layer protein [Bacillus cereus VD118]MBJ7986644.1 S-layer homology domain-containing protein [Bacillus cereus]MCQ6357585.1 S-layer homology domain-containing protein [Bacillus cereus]OOQ96284.1 S-layer protein [Bacillus cereus]QWG27097.1 S-layer homology domain-containing protein [Bacillus mycoides]